MLVFIFVENCVLSYKLYCVFQSLSKKWVAKDLLRLEESVFVSVKRQVVSRLLAKKAKLEEQLETCENSDVNSELLRISEQLNEIQNMRKIDLLRKYRNNERVDWLCIAVIDFAGRRGDRDLELIWENLVWPNISLPQWDNVNLTVSSSRATGYWTTPYYKMMRDLIFFLVRSWSPICGQGCHFCFLLTIF